LFEVRPEIRNPIVGTIMRARLALGVSTLLLILLPAGGMVGGGYGGYRWANPTGLDCGLVVFPLLLVTVLGALLGLAVGLATAWLSIFGLARWANRGGLADIRDDPPLM
jgi:hypothetical protein